MNTILEAIEAARQRNMMQDQQRAVPAPVLPTQAPVIPIIPQGDGDNGGPVDTRTPHQKYLDAIDANKYVGAVPVIGPVLGLMNDSLIESYEKANPDMVVGGGISKYSNLGRAMGKGLTAEEQVQAKKAGLGLFDAVFGESAAGGYRAPSYSLFDRVFGRVPANWAAHSDYIGVAPNMTTGGFETGGGGDDGPRAARGTTNFGGRESAIGMEDRSGYA